MTTMLAERPSSATRLRAAVMELGEARGELLSHAERAWESITFRGSRHTIEVRFKGAAGIDAGERFIAALPEHEFRIRGQLVADCAVVETEHRFAAQEMTVTAEFLLLEDEG